MAIQVERIAAEHKAVKAKLEQASTARAAQERESSEERWKAEDDRPSASNRKEAAEDGERAQSDRIEQPPTQVAPVPDSHVTQLEEQLGVLQSTLSAERADRAREGADAARLQEEATATATRLQAELTAQKANLSARAREAEQLQSDLAAATRRARESEEAHARLEKEMRQSEERMRRSEAAASYDEERRWSERVARVERQLADAEASDKRTRTELARKDDEFEQLRLSLLHTQRLLSQAEASERTRKAQCDELTASLSRLQQTLRDAVEELAQEKRERVEGTKRADVERARQAEEWQVEKQRLTRMCEEVEQRLAALQRHYLQRQQDVSDLKELLKLSVKRERDAALQVDRLRLEQSEALKAAEEWKRRWEKESREWEAQRSTLQPLAASYEAQQRAVADMTDSWRKSHSEAQRLLDDNSNLRKEVGEQKKSAASLRSLVLCVSGCCV